MKVFAMNLVANVEASVKGGNFFMLIKTTAPINATLMRGGIEIEKAEGVEAGFKATGAAENVETGGRYFDEVRILSQTTQTIRVGVSDGAGGYDRALGEVTSEQKLTQSASNMVGYDALTSNGLSFAGATVKGAVVGEYPYAQFLNPAGSGRVALIDTVRFSASLDNVITLSRYDVAILTLSQSAGSTYVGGTANKIQIRTEGKTAALLTGNPVYIYDFVKANDTGNVEFKSPIRLNEGMGLIVSTSVTNIELRVAFQWREIA